MSWQSELVETQEAMFGRLTVESSPYGVRISNGPHFAYAIEEEGVWTLRCSLLEDDSFFCNLGDLCVFVEWVLLGGIEALEI